MPRGPLLTAAALLAAVLVVKSGWLDGAGDSGAKSSRAAPAQATPAAGDEGGGAKSALPARLALGQTIVARFAGADPSAGFLARIERGEIGGVILFEENLRGGEDAIARRIRRLQNAAAGGGNPPLLIMVDQEGGVVKRLAGPPARAAAAMGLDDARDEGEATGDLLARLGIDVDLAPVADIGHAGSFLGSRTFASRPGRVAALACEFAAGLRSKGVAATLKHFPGLGLATVNTDEATATVDAAAATLRRDYAPYRRCGNEPLTLIMIDSAIYPALTRGAPAVISPSTYRHELPRAGVGDNQVTISDDLEAPAIQSLAGPARQAIAAGLDLLLYARTASTSADAYRRLLEDVRDGSLARRPVQKAATKVLSLKAELSN